MEAVEKSFLLSSSDPAPVELVNWESSSPILLVCEHAGQAIPAALGDLGVSKDVLNSHRGWDLHAEKLARQIADLLQAPLIIQRYSRLLIDVNRPPNAAGSMPQISDNIAIAGNQHLSEADKNARITEIFEPFDQAITQGLSKFSRKAAFSIHSFTPNLSGEQRPWHAGFLTRTSPEVATHMIKTIASARPDLCLAVNQPYQIDDEGDWFIPVHAEAHNLLNCLIEIRNDQIGDQNGIEAWSRMLTDGMRHVLKDLP